MKFVATKTADQLDLQALHRTRERLIESLPIDRTATFPMFGLPTAGAVARGR
jgi:hypothetical protein